MHIIHNYSLDINYNLIKDSDLLCIELVDEHSGEYFARVFIEKIVNTFVARGVDMRGETDGT